MNVRLRMYKYCYSNLGAIYAKGLLLAIVQYFRVVVQDSAKYVCETLVRDDSNKTY